MGLLSSIRKSWRLMRIMKRISNPTSESNVLAQVLGEGSSESEQAVQDLLDLILNDRETRAIIIHYGVSRADMEEYYRRLCAMGLDRWIKENHAAAAAIAIKPTLIYLLDSVSSPLPEGWTDRDQWIKITGDLANYFESGRIGRVRG